MYYKFITVRHAQPQCVHNHSVHSLSFTLFNSNVNTEISYVAGVEFIGELYVFFSISTQTGSGGT